MKSQARVVVVGGGVVGCSVLYHLARFGWSDVMLIERSELTSGSTWHAAGGFHTLNADPNIAALQGYTIRLYQELEELSDQSCGLHHVGGITIAGDPERLDYLKAQRAKHRHMGLDTHMIGPDEISEICPVISTEGVLGALYDPLDGHLDPAGTTPRPMPSRHAAKVPRSCCAIASWSSTGSPTKAGTWSANKAR